MIVGINHASGAPDLPGSIRDAKNLRAALRTYGFERENITMLLDGAATRQAILSAVRRMAERTPRDGIAVFAIATHTRRSHGRNELATAEGARISARELGAELQGIRARTWIALPTCYAGGYAVPGIVGRDRIATFASSADQKSYQAGEAGSFLFIHMVRRAMLEGRAPYSVESAFEFARDELEREHPDQIPSMNDSVSGDLVLGPAPRKATADEPTSPSYEPGPAWSYATYQYEEAPSPTPEPSRRRSRAAVCGSVRYKCYQP